MDIRKEGRKLHSLYFYITKFAKELEKAETPEETTTGKWVVHDVHISFSAPPTNVTETLKPKEEKEHEPNFQWKRFSAVLSDVKKENWCIYLVELEPWGTKIKGTATVSASDYKGTPLENEPVKTTVEKIERMYPTLFSKPDLNPKYPESMITYINADKRDKGSEYSPTEFKNKFLDVKFPDPTNPKTETPFYILFTKTNEVLTPFGDVVGQRPANEVVK